MASKEASADTITEQRKMFELFVRRRGLKRSSQRGAVVDLFLHNTDHVSCEDLYSIVRKRGLKIGYSTVYRTLKLLSAANLAREVNFGDGVTRFDHNYNFNFQNHYHLVCTTCGDTVEFTSKAIEKNQKDVAKKFGFSPQHHKLEIYGMCRACRNA
ncbi:MAG: transcriptional repressor [candidate division Zixibacteria bacterium]|nr:transcriptional repressor [candidate division Zixibacteria bacterium]